MGSRGGGRTWPHIQVEPRQGMHVVCWFVGWLVGWPCLLAEPGQVHACGCTLRPTTHPAPAAVVHACGCTLRPTAHPAPAAVVHATARPAPAVECMLQPPCPSCCTCCSSACYSPQSAPAAAAAAVVVHAAVVRLSCVVIDEVPPFECSHVHSCAVMCSH